MEAGTAAQIRGYGLHGHAAMLLFAAAISLSFTIGSRAAPFIDPTVLTAARFLVGAIASGAVAAALIRREHFRAPWRYAVIGGLFAGYFILMFEALRLTDPVSVAAIFTLTPIMSGIFAFLLLRQRMGAMTILALLIGGGGALWVIFEGDIEALLRLAFERGEWLFLAGCACHALYTPLLRLLNRGEPPAVFGVGALLGGLGVALLWGGADVARTDWTALPWIVWLAIFYLGIIATAVTFQLVRYATLRLPAAKVMAYGYLVPGFVILWEGMLTGVWVAPVVWLGLIATVAALLILLRA